MSMAAPVFMEQPFFFQYPSEWLSLPRIIIEAKPNYCYSPKVNHQQHQAPSPHLYKLHPSYEKYTIINHELFFANVVRNCIFVELQNIGIPIGSSFLTELEKLYIRNSLNPISYDHHRWKGHRSPYQTRNQRRG